MQDPLLDKACNTHGQQYRNSVFCGSHGDRRYVMSDTHEQQ
jgi:hypothetical protein